MSREPTGRDAAFLEKANQQHARMESEREEEAEARLSENTGMDLVAMAPAERTRRHATFRKELRDVHDRAMRRARLVARFTWLDPRMAWQASKMDFARVMFSAPSDTIEYKEWIATFKRSKPYESCGASEASPLKRADQDFLFDYFMPMMGNTLESAWKRRLARASSVQELLRCFRAWKEASQGAEGSQGESRQEAADRALVEEVD